MLFDTHAHMDDRAFDADREELFAAMEAAGVSAIVTELMLTLDKSYPVSQNMLALYEFVNSRLIDGNINKDEKMFDEAAAIITDFRDTWKQVIQINRQKQYGEVKEI